MAGIRAIEGVDNTLVNVATTAVASLSPRPAITVGPLDRDDDELRINWFLYSVRPNGAFRNMEPPLTGTRTARGQPPLMLELGYVLTAHPGTLTAAGQQAQFASRGLAAVMQALHDRPIIAEGSPELAAEATPLVEPLRITMDGLDLDGLSKVWTSVSRPMRTTVGYRVSLVLVDTTNVRVTGPPVQERRLVVVPSIGASFVSTSPSRVAAGIDLEVELAGATGALEFTLRHEVDDPAGPAQWPLTAARLGATRYGLQIAPIDLAPGPRQLSVVGRVEGLQAGGDRAAVTIVPIVTGPGGPVAPGANVSLATAHVLADVEVFFDGVPLAAGDVTFVSASQVDIVVPATAAPGSHAVSLRSAFTAGPAFELQVS